MWDTVSDVSNTATATQELANVLLGEDVVNYVLRSRSKGTHWQQIVADLSEKTDGRVRVTERSLQLWTRDQRERAVA